MDMKFAPAPEAALTQESPHWSQAVPMKELRTPAYVHSVDEVAQRVRAL